MGSDQFVEDTQCLLSLDQSLNDIPKPQKLVTPKPLQYYVDTFTVREGMARAYLSEIHFTLSEWGMLIKRATYR
ncbi:MAG: hypothetical protein U5M23_08765 [Marinagarivorans sp.]|nr:hypothetical protein [Marinagarivorans sp.]